MLTAFRRDMGAELIIEDVEGQLARRFGRARRCGAARIFTFGSALTCSVNYSKLLHGNKYFFGLPAAFLDPARPFGETRFGEFVLLICGSPDNILVLPRPLVIDMMRGVVSRRLDIFVEGGTYILQTTRHPKLDVTEYLNRFPETRHSEPSPETDEKTDRTAERIHVKVQFALIALGQAEGCSVWVPINDRNFSYQRNPFSARTVARLPNFGFDENTRRIAQNIDVLWLRRNTIQKAFEIEATTSIYSGLLRLNDLVLSQPSVQIELYVAAPVTRRQKVYNQLLRPSFQSLLSKCEFLTFEHILQRMEHLAVLPLESGARVTGLVRGEKFPTPDHLLYPDNV